MAVSRADEEAYQRLENTWVAASQALARKLKAITGRPREAETQEWEPLSIRHARC